MMKALVFSEEKGLRLETDKPKPVPAKGEALIRVRRAGICSTDLEIIKGYIPGFDGALGHEFVGEVVECSSAPEWEGKRVAGEINCNLDKGFSHPDEVFVRNHAPQRTVLGIIGKDGTMAEYITLPVENLHNVPEELSDQEAAFTEPLAAACRIVEQQAVRPGAKVAVIGDGKFGLLIAQNLVVAGHEGNVTHFGRHEEKLELVQGTQPKIVDDATKTEFAQAFDVVVEASGTSNGILLAVALCRPLGTIVLKSTCSTTGGADMPVWGEVANQIVVQEMKLIGSRCGPFVPALRALQDRQMKALVNSMVDSVVPLSQGLDAIKRAQTKGVIKVVIDCQQ